MQCCEILKYSLEFIRPSNLARRIIAWRRLLPKPWAIHHHQRCKKISRVHFWNCSSIIENRLVRRSWTLFLRCKFYISKTAAPRRGLRAPSFGDFVCVGEWCSRSAAAWWIADIAFLLRLAEPDALQYPIGRTFEFCSQSPWKWQSGEGFSAPFARRLF